MKSVILLGQTNVGKTLFALNFAEYLGMEQLAITFKNRERGTYSRSFTLLEARSLLVSQKQHQTRDILSIVLSLPKGKGNKQFELLDTAGLNDGIHEDHRIRQAMAQTLRYIRQADIIFHMLIANLLPPPIFFLVSERLTIKLPNLDISNKATLSLQ